MKVTPTLIIYGLCTLYNKMFSVVYGPRHKQPVLKVGGGGALFFTVNVILVKCIISATLFPPSCKPLSSITPSFYFFSNFFVLLCFIVSSPTSCLNCLCIVLHIKRMHPKIPPRLHSQVSLLLSGNGKCNTPRKMNSLVTNKKNFKISSSFHLLIFLDKLFVLYNSNS